MAAGNAANKGADRLEWFRKAKFGMFIHWGIYSVPAGQWKGRRNYAEWIQLQAKIPASEYEKFASKFNPVKFDAKQWVQVAKQAGMKYMVITAKHHDGFCMFDSKQTNYDIVDATPYGKDPMKALSKACREAGLKFCFYYSLVDWHHPEFPAKYAQRGFHGNPNPNADISKYADYEIAQIKELLSNYGPIGIIWFDGGGSFRGADRVKLLKGKKLVDVIHSIQPKCLINNRLGIAADYGTPEQHIPKTMLNKPFEVCMTLNHHWGYNKADNDWKSPKIVIRNLADIAHKGGNYLLNVGPTAEGLFPKPAVEILHKVGEWMAVNGDAIYGTTRSILPGIPRWGRITTKGKTLFLHVFDRPADGKIQLPAIKATLLSARFLANEDAKISFERQDRGYVIDLPGKLPDPIDSVVRLTFDRDLTKP
ncbi:MAG: alpha-L-fucosidase [Planctomycetes bacterium]|nr:alpha-L-fucosidase [Planctomycetota bacterium]